MLISNCLVPRCHKGLKMHSLRDDIKKVFTAEPKKPLPIREAQSLELI